MQAHDPLLEIDAVAFEPDRLADPQAGAVEQLDERAVAERARRHARAASISRSASPGESVRGSVRFRRG